MNRIGVMHMTDTLDAGGAERVAVNFVNLLPRARYQPYLCTTRREGVLAPLLEADVRRINLERAWRFDLKALSRLTRFIKVNHIRIIHAHDTSLLMAAAVSLLPPHPAVVWHIHYGEYATVNGPAWRYRMLTTQVNSVIAVNQSLAEWAKRQLRLRSNQVSYIPNFVCEHSSNGVPLDLPGSAGSRIVCVANLRWPKDHLTLLRAMNIVRGKVPLAHLLLVGAFPDPAYLATIQKEITDQKLDRQVSLLGQRPDVAAILQASDIGVLSSASEGLPLALLEYGMKGLPVVTTQVGQCAEVVDEGRAGILVPPGNPENLAEALVILLTSPEQRRMLGTSLRRRIEKIYSAGPIIDRICQVYDSVLKAERGIERNAFAEA
jgi:glycosyltransferase involved in cell wall biosynthesis